MPEVADAKASRYATEFGLSPQLAKELAAKKELSAFFDECAKLHDGYQEMAGLIVGELSGEASPRRIRDSRGLRGACEDGRRQLHYSGAGQGGH